MCGDARVRTYCQYSPGPFYCAECYASHRIEEDRRNNHEAEFDFFLFEKTSYLYDCTTVSNFHNLCIMLYIEM